MPTWIISVVVVLTIPFISYFTSVGMSVLLRLKAKCKTVDFKNILINNLFIGLSTLIAGVVLAFENIPILKTIFGEYEPVSRVTGLQIPKDAVEYNQYILDQTHYKIQTFSNIVKDALPFALSDSTKTGLVYFYYMFFLTLLPSFFIFSTQSIC